MVLFSSIIPTYNRARLIEKTLDSVLSQECNDQEIIVVDDGSTDDTLNILKRYGDLIKVIHQENKGPGAARNLGIRYASGKYITFLDSDDIWFPWTLSTLAQVIRENHLPAFVAGTEVNFQDEVELKSVGVTSLKYEYFQDYYSSANKSLWIGTCAAAIRADDLQKVNGYTELRINAEDSDLWLRLGTAQGFAYIHSPPVFGYRRHLGSAISQTARTYQGICYLIQQERENQYPGGEAQKRERLEILMRHIRPVSFASLNEGEIKKGWKLYQETFKWHFWLGRFRYIVGFPLIASLTILGMLSKPKKYLHIF